MSNPLKRWKIPTAEDETCISKRTQICMFLKRGYYVSDGELQLLSFGPGYHGFVYARHNYYSRPSQENKEIMENALKLFIEESNSISYEEFLHLKEGFVRVFRNVANSKSISFRSSVSGDYPIKYGSVEMVRVIFMDHPEKQKIQPASITFLIADAVNTKNIKKLIIIIPVKYTDALNSYVKKMDVEIDVEVFPEESLRFDPTEHKLQPDFHIMNSTETKDFLNLGYPQQMLPKILSRDPVVRFLDVGSKKIFEYHRVSPLNEISKTSFYARTM